MSTYFEKRTRKALDAQGFTTANAGELTAWAEAAHGGDRGRGVIITSDGVIRGETFLSRTRPDGPTIWRADTGTEGMDSMTPNPVDWALGAVHRATGLQATHIRYYEVCEG